MCHLLLALPVLALAVFWIWPLPIAAPIYAVVVLLSGALYWKMMKAMARPAAAGVAELAQSSGEVVAVDGDDVRVLVHGEHWSAHSPDALQVGDQVQVTGVEGMTLAVRRRGPGLRTSSGPESPEQRAPEEFSAPR